MHDIVPTQPTHLYLCKTCLRILVGKLADGCQSCEGREFLAVPPVRHCRVCGCHHGRACLRDSPSGRAICDLASEDLCSFCDERLRG